MNVRQATMSRLFHFARVKNSKIFTFVNCCSCLCRYCCWPMASIASSIDWCLYWRWYNSQTWQWTEWTREWRRDELTAAIQYLIDSMRCVCVTESIRKNKIDVNEWCQTVGANNTASIRENIQFCMMKPFFCRQEWIRQLENHEVQMNQHFASCCDDISQTTIYFMCASIKVLAQ